MSYKAMADAHQLGTEIRNFLERNRDDSDAINELNERGLDTRFVDYLVSDDSEQTFERIKEFNALIDDVVNKEIKSLTRQSPIKVGGTNLNTKNETNTDVLDIARQSRIIK